jgi:RNA polymerase sigma-70 factor (ECF subfamily)
MTNTKIFNDYNKLVFGQVMVMVKNYEDAQDVTQNVFKKIVSLNSKESTRFNDEKAAIGTWIRTIVVHVTLDFFKMNHPERQKLVSEFVNDDGNDIFQFDAVAKTPEKVVMEDELKQRLLKAFRGLKPKHRKIAMMYFMREYSYEEIANELDIPMGTVKGLLSRAKKELQKQLSGMYDFKKEAMSIN